MIFHTRDGAMTLMRSAIPRRTLDSGSPRVRILLGIGLVCWLSGCGGGGGDTPDMYTTTGVVTYNGEPVAGANVVFHPIEDDRGGRPATGVTNEAGEFSLRMFGQEGAVPGDYKVTVVIPPPMTEATDESVYAEPTGEEESPIPRIYTTVLETPLTATITENGENNFPFTLEDQ
jgi:hypothetical protein